MSEKLPVPDFNRVKDELFKSLPHDVANIALAHFKGSFLKQGFTETSFIPWVKRNDDTTHPVSYTHLDVYKRQSLQKAHKMTRTSSTGWR